MVGQLYFVAPIQVALEYIERTFFFTQVVERLVVATPYWVAVFSVEGGQFLVSALVVDVFLAEPDVACNGRSMMFAPRVFVAFLVVIEQGSPIFSHADVFHGKRGIQDGASSLGVDFIYLRKLGTREGQVCRIRHHTCSEQKMPIVSESNGQFIPGVGGKSFGGSSLFGD